LKRVARILSKENLEMKFRILVAPVLALALTAPVCAHQDDSNKTNQNTPASQASGDQTLAPLSTDRHEGFWGKINPMARKKYVQRQMEPIRNRVNELDELTAANSRAIKDVDARAQEGIRMASLRANEADLHAVDAGNRAQTANQTAQQASARLQTVSNVVSNIDQYQQVSDTEIRLRPGQIKLSKKATDAIDQMADGVKGQNAYLFEVQGFAGGTGAAAIENSQRIAESVVRYLVINHEVPVYRIYLLGMGNAPVPNSAEGKARRTRGGTVEIALLKNPNIEQLATGGALNTAGSGSSSTTMSQGGVSGATAQSSPQPGATNTSEPQEPASNMDAPASTATPPPPQQ
jgi:outer membrane protein OmpA-like peptidoglycan-associated protein